MMTGQWFIVDNDISNASWDTIQRLARGSGVLVLAPEGRLSPRIRLFAKQRGLRIETEHSGHSRRATRVHDMRELRAALLRRTPLILLSPIHPTRTHPDSEPVPPMRAAAFARLAVRRLIALGGMDARKFRRVEQLGFQAWAGISAFRT
jgi:thiamine-phosphate pyrophosphorylase